MDGIKESGRRWTALVCPDCRFVFRVPKDHDGLGIVCPSCKRVLKIPGAGDVPPPLLAPIKKLGTIEVGEDSLRTKSHKKRRGHESSLNPLWDYASGRRPRSGKQKFLPMLIGSIILFSLIGAGLFYTFTSGKTPAVVSTIKPSAAAALPPRMTLFDRSQPSLTAECEPLARKFMEAKTVEEILPLIYQPSVAEPRMREYYKNGSVLPEGMTGFNVGQGMQVLGNFVSFVVKNNDFDQKNLAFVDGADGLKIHWESYVGWSDMPWDEFSAKKPTTPQFFRVILAPVEYYNFAFSDDIKWQSYRIESPDKAKFFYGYVEKDSPLNAKLKLNPDVKSLLVVLTLKFPEGSQTNNQVLIENKLYDGWVGEVKLP